MKDLTPLLAGDFDGLVRQHVPRPIHDDAAYRNAMAMLDALADLPELNGDQLRYFETLSLLTEAYEHRLFPTWTSDPVEHLKFMLRGW